MHGHGADSDAHHAATSPSSSQDHLSLQKHRVFSGDPRANPAHPLKHLVSPMASGSGSGSSKSNLPQMSFGDGTAPSSSSRIRTSDTSLATPNLVESPRPITPGAGGKHIPLSSVTGLHAPSPGTSPPSQAESPPFSSNRANETSGSPSSADEQLPTRASIRAWAKATPAGPPRYTPSPEGSPSLPQSSSDENLDRQSITRSAGHHTVSSVSQTHTSGSGSGTSSSDGDDSTGSRNLPFPDESSGNVADIESSGSGGEDTSPQDTSDLSPSASPPDRELLAPAPLHPPQPQPQAQTHAESSASESPPPAGVVTSAQIQEQQDRIDRRGDRHPSHHHTHTHHHHQQQSTGRRRHRDRDREHRERRSRASNPTPPHPQVQPQPQPQQQQPQPRQHQHGRHSRPSPLTFVPELRLPPPPPPLRPLRPLQAFPSGGGDVLDDIARMLQYSRRPLLRTGVDPGGTRGAFHSPPRGNDVLDDICFMIQMSNGR